MTLAQPADPVYRFDNNELRPATRQLLVAGQAAALGARAFDVLLALVTHRERMLTKAELLDMVWPNLVVEENNLQVHVSALRKLLGAKAIATVPGRGYRFAAALDASSVDSGTPPVPAMRAIDSPAVAALPADAGNLLAPLQPLLGRAAELAQLGDLVRQHRLVSVLGAGGIGKTSLARAAARQLAGVFRDGVWMAELAATSDAAALPGAVARALGINLPGMGDAAFELAERLRGRELLVLDNCEHLIESAASLARLLLDTVPELHILVTSQEPLKLAAEVPMRLDALAVPPRTGLAALDEAAHHGAVALFVTRVGAVLPGFRLDASNLDAVIDICRALDGMPLALEFAAARVPLLGVEGVRQHLAQRLRVLKSGTRDAPSRQRTLRATLDWSHALLTSDEQTVFRRLGVFVGGFGLELAQQVASDPRIDAWAVLDHLGSLIDKSMVVVEPGAVPRYRLLETARAYAREQLDAAGEWDALCRWHASCTRAVIARDARYARLGRESIDQWRLACSPEIDNLGSAIAWACGPSGDAALALDLVNIAALLMYQAGRYPEGVRWMLMAQPFITDQTPALVAAGFRFGLALVGLHGGVGTRQRAQLLEQARETFEQDGTQDLALVHTLCMSAYVAAVRGDFDLADRRLAQCGKLAEHRERQAFLSTWLYATGIVKRYHDRPQEALAAFARALPLMRREGDARMLFYVLTDLANTHHELGHLDEAVLQYRAVLEHLERLPTTDAQMMAFALVRYVLALTDQGALADARAQMLRSLPHCRRSLGLRHFTGMFAPLAARCGRLREAALLIGCDDAAREWRGEVPMPAYGRTLKAALALVSAAHPPALVEAWRLEGAGLDDDAIVALLATGFSTAPD